MHFSVAQGLIFHVGALLQEIQDISQFILFLTAEQLFGEGSLLDFTELRLNWTGNERGTLILSQL